ncbi:hypothetical protein [Amaricoccus solimangrovi]|uniref:Uncharacterized protein n=1 Tax=Amaricoccus solimangrovi TaxID=2589815 RepID=A0A501WT91_9RHOB|nr:hypothetical protein [Amaricoccus solimangrovi]TPE52598.1 hypothetical protein FJM51_05310 [Amaricoccus solimangrovi]
MAVSTPCAPPARLTAGDSWVWEIADPADYPSAQFVLSYALAPLSGGAVVTIEAEAPSPVAVAFRFGATATASLAPGRWRWSLVAADLALDLRATLASGVLEVLADPLASGDTRTAARRILEAIDATIAGKVTKDAQSYAIEGRTISRIPLPELMAARTRYAAIVRREDGSGPISYRPMRFADDV